jgi:hypothetical protein
VSKLIPNENTWLGFSLACLDLAEPLLSEVTGAVNLTKLLMSINASTTGNTVPTPTLDTKFETSIPGTVTAAFSADFYRDDENDLAWETLPRNTKGFFFLCRFGGSGPLNRPNTGDPLEVWPVMVTSRSNSNNTNNAVMTFTATCSIPVEPVEDAVVAAA